MIKKTRKLHKLLKWNRYEMPHVARLSSLCCKRCLLFLGRSQHLFQLLWTASRLYWYLLHFPMPANTLPHSPPPITYLPPCLTISSTAPLCAPLTIFDLLHRQYFDISVLTEQTQKCVLASVRQHLWMGVFPLPISPPLLPFPICK